MTFDLNAILLSIGAGAAAGLVGCFAVMRRMTLAADAISHIALPGIGVAILPRIHPIIGGVAALLLGTLLVGASKIGRALPQKPSLEWCSRQRSPSVA